MITLAELRKRAKRLGYGIRRRYYSVLAGQTVPYATLPIAGGGGSINLHANKEQVAEYLTQVEKVRSWQTDRPS